MTRTLMAVAMLFAVQTNASAQLGGLMKKAKNAAEKTKMNRISFRRLS